MFFIHWFFFFCFSELKKIHLHFLGGGRKTSKWLHALWSTSSVIRSGFQGTLTSADAELCCSCSSLATTRGPLLSVSGPPRPSWKSEISECAKGTCQRLPLSGVSEFVGGWEEVHLPLSPASFPRQCSSRCGSKNFLDTVFLGSWDALLA